MIGLFKGLHATISHLLKKKVTIQYPEERRDLPARSRGLIRLRLKPDSNNPRCISCSFCEQVCPGKAIKVDYEISAPENVWTLDAKARPMLCHISQGEKPIGIEQWPEGGGTQKLPPRQSCLAATLAQVDKLTPNVLTKAARRNGVWLSQAFGVATFYDELNPAMVTSEPNGEVPTHWAVADGTDPILLAGYGSIDPEKINDYTGQGGYRSLAKTLTEMTPADAIEEVAISGLRGRGGAGAPVSKKWKQMLESDDPVKYIICNAQDGDRGSFKDRSLLENNPHSVIEGMIIAGYATGAEYGIIYICKDNELAVDRAYRAIDQAAELEFLGVDLPGTDFSFSIKIIAVPRAFIGAEETALIATLEGKRPAPSQRPPYPSEKGLFGKPTVIENAETLAILPWIINNGARAFQKIGAENAPGTKLYSLTGAISEPGLYEATLNTSLKTLVNETAGGFTGGEPKAALVGGTGGGFLSPGLFDIPLDFDSVRETGGELSSGAVRVLADDECIVATVKECLRFSASESCGKCTPCRLGNMRLLEIIERICNGDGSMDDLEMAEELAHDVADGAFCQLGRGSVKPLLTGLEFFREEFTNHAENKQCNAGKCIFH